jgi:hypothetical protein
VNRAGAMDPAEPAPATVYQLETARISGRSSRPVLLVAATIVGLLAIAIVAGEPENRGVPANGRPLGGAGPAAPSSERASTGTAVVRCHDLAAGPCRRVAAAAMDAIGPDAAVESIDVWRSLLCGNDLDCPPSRLARLRPLGSAVVGLGAAEKAARVNVGERLPDSGAGPPAFVAWLIR